MDDIVWVSPRGDDRQIDGKPERTLRLQEAIDKAEAGTTIKLLPGIYDEPGVFSCKHGTKDSPIVLEGDGGVTLDGGRMPFRPPDDHPDFDNPAFLKIRNSKWIVIHDLAIQNAWPTAIYVENSQHLNLGRLNFRGGTFAFFCRGKQTRDVHIHHCAWSQDPEIWQGILWKDIHVPPRPRKELDGDFLRTVDVYGRFRITNNLIADAFNGIHFFADEEAALGEVNNDIVVADNTFTHIRDNAVESEYQASNWWVYGNRIHNCHSWFAFENSRGGHWYVFANTGRFDSKPGPPGDEFSGGGVLKTTKKTAHLNAGPFYMFHNSWYLRSAYLKKGLLDNIHHFNNAVEYCDPAHLAAGVGHPCRRMFAPADADRETAGLFEFVRSFQDNWRDGVKDKSAGKRRKLAIRFENDICNHTDLAHLSGAPDFEVRDIHLSACLENPRSRVLNPSKAALLHRSIGYDVALANGGQWKLPAGLNIGAMGGEGTKEVPFFEYGPGDFGCPTGAVPTVEVPAHRRKTSDLDEECEKVS